ncbi:hypothetical protein CEXT_247491 [Caerostris extrusa]|uniref:Secreted protein n=1 Tax=Caerostris extrusa TaxID=172846 RepID=A0AAV4XTP6_CAEEX|nr:hypothetical protein CEXT_247491 [Caerostris extrusa]
MQYALIVFFPYLFTAANKERTGSFKHSKTSATEKQEEASTPFPEPYTKANPKSEIYLMKFTNKQRWFPSLQGKKGKKRYPKNNTPVPHVSVSCASSSR